MSSTASTPPDLATNTASRRALVPYRLNVAQFERMIDAGVFRDRDRVELVRGRLVRRMTKHEPHNFTVGALAQKLRELTGAAHHVREEKSVRLGTGSRPVPDIVVVRGTLAAHWPRGPEAGDLSLVVEVADTSQSKDRGPMWRLYAEAGVPVYWIVDVPARRVEVHTEPSGKSGYRKTTSHGPGDVVPVVVDGANVGGIAVDDVVP